uniref:phosphoribosylglycinamide formyltransferase n=1 Tax=Ndongobacter massiliensis TaxID=1871025 RepID=UPI000931A6BE|nr:formyltransferase family protein [Ndongobacter massiliensis]
MKKIAVFLTDDGTGMQTVIDACVDHLILARLSFVVGTTGRASCLTRARDAGIEYLYYDPKKYDSTDAFFGALKDRLRAAHIDLLVLLDFGMSLPDFFIREFSPHIVAFHPSLERAHMHRADAGIRAAMDVHERHETRAGCMALLLQSGQPETYPILRRETVPVFDDDSVVKIHQRVKKAESYLVQNVLISVLERRTGIDGNGNVFFQ